MNTIVGSLSNLIQILTDSFRLSSLFPALFFIILNRLFILRYFEQVPPFSEITKQDLWNEALILSMLALLLGYTVNALEVPIVRLYEGYPWQDTWPGKHWTQRNQMRLKNLKRKCEETNRDLFKERDEEVRRVLDARIKDYRTQMTSDFPPDVARILPTKLGNVIAAFEAYPWERYRMDGVTFWPRILPVLDKEGYLPYINQTRSTMDFLLNSSFLMLMFGLECMFMRIFFVSDISWILSVAALGAAWVFYQAAISSAYDWGAFFHTAFDLFRYHLATHLGLKVAASFQDERRHWENLTAFWNAQHKAESFHNFKHSPRKWPVQPKEKKNSGG